MRETIERVLSGASVLIPSELAESIGDVSRGRKGRDVTALVWSYVNERCETSDDSSVPISANQFQQAIPAGTETIANAKTFLEERGFLWIDPSYVAGIRSKRYQAYGLADTEYVLTAVSPTSAHGRMTQNEECCVFTRDVLDRLEFDQSQFFDAFEDRLARKPPKKSGQIFSTVYPAARLVQQTGRVFRDKNGRLHSPFVQLCSDYRPCFTLNGQPLASVDMRACQPALLGLVSGDDLLVEDCASNFFYFQIADLLDCTRKEAKAAYCAFAYGPIRKTETLRNQSSFRIQELFIRKYPTAFNRMLKFKQGDYRPFSNGMQRLESTIFVDGVSCRLGREGFDHLTVHDGLYFPDSEENRRRVQDETFDALREKFSFISPQHIYLSSTIKSPSRCFRSQEGAGCRENQF